MKTLSDLQKRLLNLLQEEIPLVPRPFEAIARRLETSEDQILSELAHLKAGPHPVIRQISAIFDTAALGYRTSLVAARVEPTHLDQAAAVINQHPGVSHNYARSHAYNLWYTLAVPPDSRLGLDKTVDILHRTSGAIQTRLMPTLKLFKIGVRLKVGDTAADPAARSQSAGFSEGDRNAAMAFPVTDTDKRLIRVLQQDLPVEPSPFNSWAAQAQVSVDELLQAIRRYESRHQMRRFSAVLHHRQAGFSANGMGVWKVPSESAETFGQTAATFDAVSHCYLRPTYEDWHYNLFTMVHARTPEDCQEVLAAIAKVTGVSDYAALYSVKEYKKVRMQYFTPEVEAWELQYG